MSATASSLSGLVAVTFDATSQGQLAMAIYEWQDASYLGKVTIGDDDLPVSVPRSSNIGTRLQLPSRKHIFGIKRIRVSQHSPDFLLAQPTPSMEDIVTGRSSADLL
jgi:hypothetical protein